jgi:hypothetical protein
MSIGSSWPVDCRLLFRSFAIVCAALSIELALRQQLAVLKRWHKRPRIGLLDKLFWVAVRRFWSGWQQSLIVVTPETGAPHRAGFRLYRKPISKVRRPVGETTDVEVDSGIDLPNGRSSRRLRRARQRRTSVPRQRPINRNMALGVITVAGGRLCH